MVSLEATAGAVCVATCGVLLPRISKRPIVNEMVIDPAHTQSILRRDIFALSVALNDLERWNIVRSVLDAARGVMTGDGAAEFWPEVNLRKRSYSARKWGFERTP